MIAEPTADQPHVEATMCQSDNVDFIDRIWGYFLQDEYDDKFSLGSHDEIVSDDGYESRVHEELESRANDTGEDYSRYTDGEDYTRYTAQDEAKQDASVQDRKKYSDLEDYNLSATESMSKKSMILDASLRRTMELLEYARKLEASKRKAAKERRSYGGRRKGNRKRIDQIPEDREYDLQVNVDIDAARVGPPQMIYVKRDPYGDVGDDDDGVDSRNIREVHSDACIGNIMSIDEEKEGDTERSTPSGDSRIEDIIAKRKELYRRIALLRIKAAKVRDARS